MAFINNIQFKEIRNAAKNGNENAKMILQAMRKMQPQNDIDRLVQGYYGVESHPNSVESTMQTPDVEDAKIDNTLAVEPTKIDEPEIPAQLEPEETVQIEESQIEDVPVPDEVETGTPVDLSSMLDGEFDGLLDENNIEDINFSDFLENKKKEVLRAKKNSDYFKAFDMEGRKNYMNNKIDSYKNKFNGKLKDIERSHADMDKAISGYTQNVNDMLDDDIEFSMDTANNAYNDMTGNEDMMKSFSRYWDELDSSNVVNELKNLIGKYGKKNVMAALNNLKNDNDNYKMFRNNQIDNEISRYSKSIENLLK